MLLSEYWCMCVCISSESFSTAFGPHVAFVTTQPKPAQNNLAESSIRLLDTRNEIIAGPPRIIDPRAAVNINEVALRRDKCVCRLLRFTSGAHTRVPMLQTKASRLKNRATKRPREPGVIKEPQSLQISTKFCFPWCGEPVLAFTKAINNSCYWN